MRFIALVPAIALLPVLGLLAGLSIYSREHAWDYSNGYQSGYTAGLSYSRDYENRMAAAGLCVYADLACKTLPPQFKQSKK